MFTGLVQEKGTIKAVRSSSGRTALEIEAAFSGILELGESVAVNGVCLTVVQAEGGYFVADVSPETMRVTTIGRLKKGDAVNLERAMALGDRLGGHLVYGHVDGVGRLGGRRVEKNALVLTVEVPSEVLRYVVERGSITIEGVSLTAYDVRGSTVHVSVIPHTAAETTLGSLKPGDPLNLEADIIGKYVEKFVGRAPSGGLSANLLKEYGYM